MTARDRIAAPAPATGVAEGVSRRGVLAGALALGACARSEPAGAIVSGPAAPLRSAAPFPIGVCAQVSHLRDPSWVKLALAQCSQLTPEWEMKMEYIVQPDGQLRFDRPDAIAAFVRAHGWRLYGTTLVWYIQKPAYFRGLQGAEFARAFDRYIMSVVSRYRGQAAAWDVVNEPIADEGDGWRPSLWSERLGDFDHMRRAFDLAQAADPNALRFINEFNLEHLPAKLDAFQRLIERLLKSGAPVTGIGCQTHTWTTLQPGKIREAVRAIGRFGLPVHMSELDVSTVRGKPWFRSPDELLQMQARVYAEAVEAFTELPASQQFAITLWGLRDKDSWLVRENSKDAPAVFDAAGHPKPAAVAITNALRGTRS